MPTISEVANVTLKGFDRGNGKYRGVKATSPMADRLALVHGAAKAHALAHAFEPHAEGKAPGLVGRLNMRGLIRELFGEEVEKEEKLSSLSNNIQTAATRNGLLKCIDSSGRLQGRDSVWWVADDFEAVMGHPPLEGRRPPAARRKKAAARTRKPPQAVADRMYRVRAVLDEVGGAYDTALTYNEIAAELESRGQAASYGQVVTAVSLLEAGGEVRTRQMTAADKDAIRSAGGDPPGGIPPVLVMLRKNLEDGKIPTLLGTLEQLRATEGQGEPEAAAPGTPAADAPGDAPEPPEAPPSDWAQEELEAVLRDTMDMPVQEAREALVVARMRLGEMSARVADLEKARDGLLAALRTMKD